jgi:hypothetical protein
MLRSERMTFVGYGDRTFNVTFQARSGNFVQNLAITNKLRDAS